MQVRPRASGMTDGGRSVDAGSVRQGAGFVRRKVCPHSLNDARQPGCSG